MSNTLTLVGNLTRDPELRVAPSGVEVLTFGIAVNKNKKAADGRWESEPHYFDCVIFGEAATNFAASYQKGHRVMVLGKLEQRTWDDKDTGGKRSKVEIMVEEVAACTRWATVTITKVDRPEGGNKGYRGEYVEAGNRQAPSAPARDMNFNDEPF